MSFRFGVSKGYSRDIQSQMYTDGVCLPCLIIEKAPSDMPALELTRAKLWKMNKGVWHDLRKVSRVTQWLTSELILLDPTGPHDAVYVTVTHIRDKINHTPFGKHTHIVRS